MPEPGARPALPEWMVSVLRIGLPLLMALIAFVVLQKMAGEIRPEQLKASLHAYTTRQFLLAMAAVAVSYLTLSQFDVVILNAVLPGRVPPLVPALAGAAGFAVSNLLGVSWLTGSAIRYRVYSAFDVDIATVARVIGTVWIGFCAGLALLIGALLIRDPAGLAVMIHLPKGLETLVGFGLVGAVLFLLWITRGAAQSIRWRWFRLDLPRAPEIAKLTALSIVDLAATAAVLYVFMPDDLTANLSYYFIVFTAATGLGIASHSPGGLGVFEATLLTGLGATGRADALAALLCYRLIYYGLPFLVAVVGLAVAWTLSTGAHRSDGARTAYAFARPVVPVVAAALALLSGVILLISGNLPSDTGRLAQLRAWVPLPLVEASHLLGSVAGLLLIVVARGLYRRLNRAWLVAVGLLGLGFVLVLLRGIDWEESVALAAALLMMVAFRTAFYRVTAGSVFRLNARWLATVMMLAAAIFWIGLFAFQHVAYSDNLWWRFAWNGDAPRFLRSSLAVAVVLAAISLNTLLSRSSSRLLAEPVPDAVRGLIASSPDSEAAMALTGDKRFIVAADGMAFLSYVDGGGTLIAKGDPVGNPDSGRALVWQLRELADRMGRRCAFYGASEKYLTTYLDLGLTLTKIGELARVDLTGFTLDGSSRKEFRYARSRVQRDGLQFAILRGAEVVGSMAQLSRVSDAWLAVRPGGEKHFAVGAFDPDYLRNFQIAVLRHATTGKIAAFTNLLRSGDRNEVSVDLMRHDPEVKGPVMDALFAEVMLWGAAEGYRWFSLGNAPLAGLENRPLAPVWSRVGSFAYQNGNRFYHFEGLRAWKQKFDPVWTPSYLASPGGLDVPRVIYEINMLVSGGVIGALKR